QTGRIPALWTDMGLPSPLPGFPGSGEDAFFALVDPPALMAAATAPGDASATLPLKDAAPILAEAIARWAAAGMDTSALGSIQVVITNLPGNYLGLASGNTIWLDANAAGWGWFVDRTPADDSEFTTPGNQGEMNRMD